MGILDLLFGEKKTTFQEGQPPVTEQIRPNLPQNISQQAAATPTAISQFVKRLIGGDEQEQFITSKARINASLGRGGLLLDEETNKVRVNPNFKGPTPPPDSPTDTSGSNAQQIDRSGGVGDSGGLELNDDVFNIPESEKIFVGSGGGNQQTIKIEVPGEISQAIRSSFGDDSQDAASVLHHPYIQQKKGLGQGENAGFVISDIDRPNHIDSDVSKPIIQIYNPFTDSNEDSIDRGLFRINNNRFYDILNDRRDGFRNAMFAAGLIDEKHDGGKGLTPEVAQEYWDRMDNLEDNVKMAKIIFDIGGWDGWFAAPAYLVENVL